MRSSARRRDVLISGGGGARRSIRHSLRAGANGAGQDAQSLLPGSPLHGHGSSLSRRRSGAQGGQGRRGMGRRVDPGGRDPSDVESDAFQSGALLGRPDIDRFRAFTDRIHAHGSLAAIELVHGGVNAANRLSRIPPLAPSHALVNSDEPVQARAMDEDGIRAFRRWHRDAAVRARPATSTSFTSTPAMT